MQNLITTREAQCKDCYRCLRSCPVKAISFSTKIQARVEEERCIRCGQCVVECPQQAKAIRSDLACVKELLASGEKVVLSLAPSFPASFTTEYQSLQPIFSRAGFMAVEETALGAAYTTREYSRIIETEPGKTWLSSCCPVIVTMVEKYYPQLTQNLMPVLSPMVAHCRAIKSRYGADVRVVFAGPCIAKLQEAEEFGVDAALTFCQLKELLPPADELPLNMKRETGVKLNTRMYPIHQGVLFSFQEKWEFDEKHWAVEGIDQCRQVLEAVCRKEINPLFLEMMACTGGCVGGPAIDSPYSLYQRKQRVTEFYRQGGSLLEEQQPGQVFSMHKSFSSVAVPTHSYTPEEISAVLAKMGKTTPEDERNCEGCGYKSCRDKAIAVLSGMAVPEMCIPYMRAKAESFADSIVQNTPNAIVVLDEKMRILDYNPAAIKLLDAIPINNGLVLKTYLDTTNFEQCLLTQTEIREIKVDYPQWGLHTRQIITPLGERLVMGIFTDLTQAQVQQEQVQKMKAEITTKAREVLNRQMTVAQTIAGLLGETTAETKATLLEILKHLDGEAK